MPPATAVRYCYGRLLPPLLLHYCYTTATQLLHTATLLQAPRGSCLTLALALALALTLALARTLAPARTRTLTLTLTLALTPALTLTR